MEFFSIAYGKAMGKKRLPLFSVFFLCFFDQVGNSLLQIFVERWKEGIPSLKKFYLFKATEKK
jgi:hypothetical protein